MQQQNELSDSIGMAMLLGLSVAILLTAFWFVYALVTWNFSVSLLDVRTLLVLTAAGSALGYILGKFAFAKDIARHSNLRLISPPSRSHGQPVRLQRSRQYPDSAAKRRSAS